MDAIRPAAEGPCGDGFVAFIEAWNAGMGIETPALHRRIAAWLEESWVRGERRLLLLAFRSAGKSTIVGLFCAWLLSRDADLRILVLAADLALARKMVRFVKRVIERHPRTQGLRPKQADQWAAEQFTVLRPAELRDPSMLARGIATNVTGSRADVVICDDVEVPRTSDSIGKRADLRDRLREIDYVIVPGGLQLYIGTPHSYYTIYATAARAETGEERPFLDGFARLELPLLDAEGAALWPERFPPEKIDALRRRTGPAKFASQMLLQPMALADGRLDPEQLVPYEGELHYREGNGFAELSVEGTRLLSATAWWDPAYGAPKRGDASVVAAVYTDAAGAYWLHRVLYLTHDPAALAEADAATQQCRAVARFMNELYLPSIVVEKNGIGGFLPGLLRRALVETGVGGAVIEKANTLPKQKRILDAFDARLDARMIRAHRSVWATPFIAEMREWRPHGKSPDDGLDAVAGCLLEEPVRLRSMATDGPRAEDRRRPGWRGGARVFHAATNFDV